MKLLALDTSTEACSVALYLDGAAHEHFELVAQQHSSRLLPMVDACLAEAGLRLTQLDGIAFGRGPGSFTGLRIGAGVVQGLAFGAQLPVAPVSSLAALAQAQAGERIYAAFDARMAQVYYGRYRRTADGLVTLEDAEGVCDPTVVPLPADAGWAGAGSGWDRYSQELRTRLGTHLRDVVALAYPHARDVARLALPVFARGAALVAEFALPEYVRDDVAKKPQRP